MPLGSGVTVMEVERHAPERARVTTVPRATVGTGEVRLAVDHFALTANNATYARTGDALGYWEVFPTAPPWGRVPAWAHLVAVESRVEGIEVGDVFHGLAPMAAEVVLAARRVGDHGFTREHPGLAAAYRHYRRLPGGGGSSDRWRETVLRPLFITSFVLDREHAHRWPGARVVLTSASSRTAIGAAHLLARRGVATTGLTSARHVETLRAVGCYADVVAYDRLEAGSFAAGGHLVWDFAGSRDLRDRVTAAVAAQPGADVVAWVRIGDLHADGRPADGELFFAPDLIAAQARAQGPVAFDAELERALAHVVGWSAGWLAADDVTDPDALLAAWHDVLRGGTGPGRAAVVSLTAGR